MAAGGLLLLPLPMAGAAGGEPRTMPMPSTPDPRQIALDLIKGMEIAVREGDLAAARRVLDKHRETIEKMRGVLAERAAGRRSTVS